MRKQVQRTISRRESLRLLGSAGMVTFVGFDGNLLQRMWRGSAAGAVEAAGHWPSVLQAARYAPKPTAALDLSQLSCVHRPALYGRERPRQSP
jgi:hypothetical protein